METLKHKKALRGLFTKTEVTEIKPEIKPKTNVKENTSKKLSVPVKVTPVERKKTFIEKEESNYSITKIQYNFDSLRAERTTWHEGDYISFINRIDYAQTEAFFLKGKLIFEIKEKFYANNKTGWKDFCDNYLNMNYTTANQYIRVAQEFEVTSNKRKDFGFEHFKALLPLNSEARRKLIENTPNSISVKSLRNLVTKTLDTSLINENQPSSKLQSNAITENLQKIKMQLDSLNVSELSQSERWKLFGAFRTLSEEMSHYANLLSKSSEILYKSKNALEILNENELNRN